MTAPTESGYYWQEDSYSGWQVVFVDEALYVQFGDDCFHKAVDIPGRWSIRLIGPDEK